MPSTLHNYTHEELQFLLKFTQALAEQNKNEANFFGLDEQPLPEPEEVGKMIAARKIARRGRILVEDKTDSDHSLRDEIKNRLKKLGKRGL